MKCPMPKEGNVSPAFQLVKHSIFRLHSLRKICVPIHADSWSEGMGSAEFEGLWQPENANAANSPDMHDLVRVGKSEIILRKTK